MIIMKAINIFILLMFLVGFCCCDDEENIHVEEEGPRRDLDGLLHVHGVPYG